MTGRRIALAALVALALAVRLVFLVGDPYPHTLAGLSGTQGETARNIVKHGKWFQINLNALAPGGASGRGAQAVGVMRLQEQRGRLIDPQDLDYTRADANPRYEPYAVHMQGVAVLLAAIWKVTGDMSYIYLQVLQVILSSLVTLLVWWISMALFGRPRAAYLAAFVYALALPLAALARIPFYDAWTPILVPAVLAAFLAARQATDDRARLRWLVVTGVATGVALWFRPPIVLLPVALAAASAVEHGVRNSLRLLLVPLGVAALLLAPWTVRNAIEFHKFIPANIGTGQVLWQGLGEKSNSFGAYNDDNRTRVQVQAVRPDLRYDTPEYDSFLLRKAASAIKDHPGYYVSLVGDRLVRGTVGAAWLSWSAHSAHWADHSPSGVSERVQWLWDKGQVAVGLIVDPLLVLFALGTVAATWRRFRREHLLLLAVPVSLLIVPILLAMEFRYVAPAAFAWIILAAFGVDALVDRVAQRRPPRSVAA